MQVDVNWVIGSRGTMRWQTADLYATTGFSRPEVARLHLFAIESHFVDCNWYLNRRVSSFATRSYVESRYSRQVTQFWVSQTDLWWGSGDVTTSFAWRQPGGREPFPKAKIVN